MESFNRHLSSKWWLLYHARWLNRVANAELSLTAFIIQLIMTFHQQWVYISKKTFYDPVLKNDFMNRNFTFGGLWDYCTTHYHNNKSCITAILKDGHFQPWWRLCKFKSSWVPKFMGLPYGRCFLQLFCFLDEEMTINKIILNSTGSKTHACLTNRSEPCSENDSSFYFFLEMAKISFLLSLGSSLLLTCWFHCVFNPLVKHSHDFDWSGGLGSLLTACLVFITLVLFAVHLWLQELNMKKRLILGQSYYLGWLVFLIYVLCGTLCFLNKVSWRVSPQSWS